jgi:hypothetical protein
LRPLRSARRQSSHIESTARSCPISSGTSGSALHTWHQRRTSSSDGIFLAFDAGGREVGIGEICLEAVGRRAIRDAPGAQRPVNSSSANTGPE